jgi:hypothetical protein
MRGWHESVISRYPDPTASAVKAPERDPAAGTVGRGFLRTLSGGMDRLTNNPVTAPALDVAITSRVNPKNQTYRGDWDKEKDKLETNVGHLETHAAIQDVVMDPRLAHADPKTVIGTYQTLAQLAPNVMRNRSVAADLIHRRLQTGPLSAFDLKQLLDMELAYTKAHRPPRPESDDDD